MRFRILGLAVVSISALLGAQASPALAQQANQNDSYDWNGFYGGANAGGAFGGSDFLTALGSGSPCFECQFYPGLGISGNPYIMEAFGKGSGNFASFIGGGQLGYNYFANGMLVGLEVDASYIHARAKHTASATGSPLAGPTTYTFTSELGADYLVTVRPRVGTTFDGNLYYLTGGLAITTLNYTHSMRTSGGVFGGMSEDASGSETKLGWTIGAGTEIPLSNSMTLKAEYLFAQFDDINVKDGALGPLSAVVVPGPGGGRVNAASNGIACGVDTQQIPGSPTPRQCFNHKADLLLHILRLGVNFKF